jgi:5S rRNA maturation endonuclease (ribonuclease M5)
MDECERLQKIQGILDDLACRAGRGAIILVEGPRDKASLEALGIRGPIVMTSQKQLFNLAESLSRQHGDIIILSDWDERGEEVARNAEVFLKSNGARPDCGPRKKLRLLTKKEIKDVESLHGYVERLRRECALKPQHY